MIITSVPGRLIPAELQQQVPNIDRPGHQDLVGGLCRNIEPDLIITRFTIPKELTPPTIPSDDFHRVSVAPITLAGIRFIDLVRSHHGTRGYLSVGRDSV